MRHLDRSMLRRGVRFSFTLLPGAGLAGAPAGGSWRVHHRLQRDGVSLAVTHPKPGTISAG